MERIWSESDQKFLKGTITSFPYERREVERVLVEFKDAGGNIVQIKKEALFRRCNCVMKDGTKRVCVPPKIGWMCKRRAVMIRTHFILESTMVERRRIANESARIEESVQAARREAKQYLDSEEGRDTVELLAEQLLKEGCNSNSPSMASEEISVDKLVIDDLDLASVQANSSGLTSRSSRQQPLLLLSSW